MGRCVNLKYNQKIASKINGNSNILRDERRISDEEYNVYFQKTRFLIIADVEQKSSVANGTLIKALLQDRPIIAPNYNPYKYYIEEFGVVLLFDGKTYSSLTEAMDKADKFGYKYFLTAIEKFKEQFLHINIILQFNKEIKNII